MKITKKELVKIYNILDHFKKLDVDKPKGYVYKSFKNLKAMQVEIDALKEIEPKGYMEFQTNVNNLLVKYSDKDLNGNPVTKDNTDLLTDLVFSDENLHECNKEIAELSKQLDRELINRENDEYNLILDQEIEIELAKFNESDMFDGITEQYLEILEKVVD